MKEKIYPTHREIIQMPTEDLKLAVRKQGQGDVEPPFSNRQIKQMKSELKKRKEF